MSLPAGLVAQVEHAATAALGGSFIQTKTSDSASQARGSAALPPLEPTTTSTAPAQSGELAFAARLTPVADNSGTTAVPEGTDSKGRTAQPQDKPAGETYQASTDAAAPADRGAYESRGRAGRESGRERVGAAAGRARCSVLAHSAQ